MESRWVTQVLAAADITIDGTRPWDIQVHNTALFDRVARGGSRALGDAYVDGWWDADDLAGCIERMSRAYADIPEPWVMRFIHTLLGRWSVYAARDSSSAAHYNAGNDLFVAMLDREYMQYSCAAFGSAETLQRAQEAKLACICDTLKVTPGMRVLDVGAGWGGFARYAASQRQAQVTGVVRADAQVQFARELCAGLPVTFHNTDYRDVTGTFDAIVACEVLEHIGVRNYDTFMRTLAARLGESGRAFVQVTTGENTRGRGFDPWLNAHIFPYGEIPTDADVRGSATPYFTVYECTRADMDYARTLHAWHQQFEAAWPTLREHYDERMHRLWRYYLLFCAGTFQAGINTTRQYLLTKKV